MSKVERWTLAVTATVLAMYVVFGCKFSREQVQELIDCCPMGEVP